MALWNWLVDSLETLLAIIHDVAVPIFGPAHAWGWAIIGLTLVVRIFLLPLAAKQFKSMRGMQELQPEIQKLKKKHKVDRDLMKKDPQKYRERKQKMNEEMMGLYKEHKVNPAMGCLPLLLQAPIFIAIFRILMDPDRVINGTLISETTFYMFSPLGAVARVHVWGWLLVVLMAGSMFVAQKQMMAKNPATEGFMAQQQKVMLYGMPVFLGVFAINFPIGVLLYWVTTNLWQMGQQALILRAVKTDAGAGEDEDKPSKKADKKAEPEQDGKKPKGAPPVPKGTGSPPRSKRDSKPGKKPKESAPKKPEPSKPAEPGGDGSRPKDDKPRPKDAGHLPPRRRGKRDS